MTRISDDLVEAVLGRWELGPHYQISISRDGEGLVVHQEARTRRGRKVIDQRVEYDGRDGTLQFTGIGTIHRVRVFLRRNGDVLDYAMRAEIQPGRWTNPPWETARRLPPAS